MALHSMEMKSKGLLKSLTSCTPHHHLISTSPMVSSRPWWRKSRMPTRKLMDLPMVKQEHYFSYETPLSQQIFLLQPKYFMDDQHKEQSFWDPESRSTYVRFMAETHWNTKQTERNSFNWAHRAKDLWVLKVNKQVQFFPNKQGTGPPTWLDRNCNWNLGLWPLIHDPRPQWQSLQEKQSSLKTHLLWWYVISRPSSEKRGKDRPEINSFQDPKPTKVKTVSLPDGHQLHGWQIHFLLWNHTHIKHPLHHHHHQLSDYTLPSSPSYSPSASRSSRESSVEPHSEDSSPTGRKRHQS